MASLKRPMVERYNPFTDGTRRFSGATCLKEFRPAHHVSASCPLC